MLRIVTVDREVILHPNKKMYEVTCLANDNSKYTAHISPAKKALYDQLTWLKSKGQLLDKDIEKIWNIVEDFGFEMYENGIEAFTEESGC